MRMRGHEEGWRALDQDLAASSGKLVLRLTSISLSVLSIYPVKLLPVDLTECREDLGITDTTCAVSDPAWHEPCRCPAS